jgi:hypothetical protein
MSVTTEVEQGEATGAWHALPLPFSSKGRCHTALKSSRPLQRTYPHRVAATAGAPAKCSAWAVLSGPSAQLPARAVWFTGLFGLQVSSLVGFLEGVFLGQPVAPPGVVVPPIFPITLGIRSDHGSVCLRVASATIIPICTTPKQTAPTPGKCIANRIFFGGQVGSKRGGVGPVAEKSAKIRLSRRTYFWSKACAK